MYCSITDFVSFSPYNLRIGNNILNIGIGVNILRNHKTLFPNKIKTISLMPEQLMRLEPSKWWMTCPATMNPSSGSAIMTPSSIHYLRPPTYQWVASSPMNREEAYVGCVKPAWGVQDLCGEACVGCVKLRSRLTFREKSAACAQLRGKCSLCYRLFKQPSWPKWSCEPELFLNYLKLIVKPSWHFQTIYIFALLFRELCVSQDSPT